MTLKNIIKNQVIGKVENLEDKEIKILIQELTSYYEIEINRLNDILPSD